jgi:hypothetical protein
MLYQLSYVQTTGLVETVRIELTNLRGAKPALSQLSYVPVTR